MIIISNPVSISNEINTIHSLFENGMELFHIRKPNFSESEMKVYINGIDQKYRDNLVLHSHHCLAENEGIKNLHYPEKKRLEISKEEIVNHTKNGIQLSTSVHSIEVFNQLPLGFNYAFLSPIYTSISKPEYSSKINLSESLTKRTNFNTKLVALGGITTENILLTLKNGFDDVALLGTIWNTAKPTENFIACRQIALSH
jgi:thiamine-phosphate pyrophosphorylase